MSNVADLRLCVIGLGKLGAPMAACLASGGYSVTGVDLSEQAVEAINAGKAPVTEPRLQEMIDRAGPRLRATTDVGGAVRDADVTFILVPTPSDDQGVFSLKHILPACREVGAALRTVRRGHTVVITSTVMPGCTEGPIRECLEEASGLQAGRDFGLCYSPEFIALGTVVRDFLQPDFVLIGELDRASGDVLAGIYSRVCENHPPAARMSPLNAELTKLAVNTYVTTKITFANTVARLCEQVPGADVDVVTDALGLDSRIGRKCLRGAVGYGGPCFPRDVVALTRFAESLGVTDTLPRTIDRLNRSEAGRLATLARRHLEPGESVAVLGLSYKPDTPVVEESQGLLLARELATAGVPVSVWDPLAMENARAALGDTVRYASSLRDCIESAAVIVIPTPWPEFRELPVEALRRSGRPVVLIDCWRILGQSPCCEVVEYVGLGTYHRLGTGDGGLHRNE